MGKRMPGRSRRVERTSVSQVTYKCLTCGWVSEVDAFPSACKRCLGTDIYELTLGEIAVMLDTHEIEYCVPCQRIHSGDILPL